MYKKHIRKTIGTVILFNLSSIASAAVCNFGSSSEPGLQSVVDGRFNPAFDVTTGCLADSNDSLWYSTGDTVASFVIEIAGFANRNTFGIYDSLNTENDVQLFSGSDSVGDYVQLDIVENGSLYDVYLNNGSTAIATLESSEFGFYISTPQNNTFYSDTALNDDSFDHMFAYQGSGEQIIDPGLAALVGDTFDEDMYVLAWEDLYGGGDRDYQDMVLIIDNITPVPVPSSIVLFASACALLGRKALFEKRAS